MNKVGPNLFVGLCNTIIVILWTPSARVWPQNGASPNVMLLGPTTTLQVVVLEY